MTDDRSTPEGEKRHELKTWPDYFTHLLDGTKTFEYRRNDRGFRVGDVLWLREWEPLAFEGGGATVGRYTGRELERRVTYLLNVSTEFVVMALDAQGAQLSALQQELRGVRAERESAEKATIATLNQLEAAERQVTSLTAERDQERNESAVTKRLIKDRVAQHKAALNGWREPDGYLVPTEPDIEERKQIRSLLGAAVLELSWALGALTPAAHAGPREGAKEQGR